MAPSAPVSLSSVDALLDRAASLAIVLMGTLALAGWALGLPWLAAWKAGSVPMSPAAACISMGLGAGFAGLTVSGRWSAHARRTAAGLALVAALASGFLLVLRLFGVSAGIEGLGLPAMHAATGGVPAGLISPVTAACYLLAAVALLAMVGSPGPSVPVARLVLACGVPLTLTGAGFLMAHAFGAPALSSGTWIPPAINTSLGVLLFGGLLLASGLRMNAALAPYPLLAGELRPLLWLFAGITLVILSAGYGFYRNAEHQLIVEAEENLRGVTDLKVRQLAHWWTERVGDASLLRQSMRQDDLRALVRGECPLPCGGLFEWLRAYQTYGQYDRADVIDDHGQVVLSSHPGGPPPAPAVRAAAPRAMLSGELTLVDFYRDDADGLVRLALLVPLAWRSGAAATRVVVALRINPDAYLYPVVRDWSTPTGTAESLLVRRDGNEAVILTRLREDRNAPLLRRVSLSARHVLDVKAALGESGLVDGVDFRGVPVKGFIADVPGSEWILVSRIAVGEISGGLWDRAQLVAGFVGLLLFSSGSLVGLLWHRQRACHAEGAATLARTIGERDRRLGMALRAGSMGSWDMDLRTGELVVSPEYAELMGYGSIELREAAAVGIGRIHPEDRERVVVCGREFVNGTRDTYQVEFRLRTRGGHWRWMLSQASVSSRAADGRPLGLSGVDVDVTSLMAAQAAVQTSLLEQEALLREVHHRVKNNLQVMTSLLRLEAARAADPKVTAALGEMQSRIRSMALLHETLYRSGNLAQVDLAAYLRQLAGQVFRSAASRPGVTMAFGLEPVMADIDTAVPCGLVVNELLSNALKHGFPDGRSGEIRLSLARVPAPAGGLRLTVADTGVGLPADFDARRQGSLGLHLVTGLVRQLQGTLEMGHGPGASFCLTFVPGVRAHPAEVRAASFPSAARLAG